MRGVEKMHFDLAIAILILYSTQKERECRLTAVYDPTQKSATPDCWVARGH
jgi:hypothetical protein